MKRLLALLLALTMVLALAACGDNGQGGETTDDPSVSGTENPDANDTGDGDVKVLRVAMECAYAPYNWAQNSDANGAVPISNSPGQYAYGYDVMIAKYIAESLGYELEITQIGWTGIIPAIQSGIVDVGICGQSVTPERMEQADFSDPYYYATIVVLVKEDGPYADATSVADLAGASATSQMETIWNDICLPQIPDVKALEGQDDAPAMTAALLSGRVDVVVTDQPTGTAAVAVNSGIKMIEFEGEGAFEVSQDEINIGISMQKGNDELREAINSVLETLSTEDYIEMMNQAAAVQPMAQ